MDVDSEQDSYFLMFEPENLMFYTIPHTDAVYESKAVVGDKLIFFWKKKKHTGILRFVNDSSEECYREGKRLKSEEKRKRKEGSLHEDVPRKSKVRCQERVRKHLQVDKKKATTSAPKPQKKKQVVKDLAQEHVDKELLRMIQEKSASSRQKHSKPKIYDEVDDEPSPPALEATDKVSIISKGSSSSKSSGSCRSPSPSSSDNSDSDEVDDPSSRNKKQYRKALKLGAQLAAKFDLKSLEDLAAGRVNIGSLSCVTGSASSSQSGRASPGPSSLNIIHTLNSPASSSSLHIAKNPAPSLASPGPSSLNIIHTLNSPASSSSLHIGKNPAPSLKCVEAATPEAEKVPQADDQVKPDEQAQAEPIPEAIHIPEIGPNPQPNAAVNQGQAEGTVGLYSGEMFLVKNPENGVALIDGKAVYCTEEKYNMALKSTSATMAGRRMLDGVFTPMALSVCSLSGLPPRGKGKQAYADRTMIKPYLSPVAVQTIVDKALSLQKEKHWHPKKDAGQIRQAMSVRVNEVARQFNNAVALP